MSKRHARHFSNKHPLDTIVDKAVMEAVSSKLTHQKITCKAAFEIAVNLSVPPSVIGVAIDLQEGRIISCQLGLFGYGKVKNKLKGATQVTDTIKTAINASLIEGRLSCKKAWALADNTLSPRLKVSQACETLGIKIFDCQLGAF